jgi:protein-L-isoaspartate(D-aspartate) O-methyltransferase
MVERQLRRRGIADERVLEAMARVPRELFVPAELQDAAYDDAALPIGEGQTISQPFVVATMLTLLRPAPGERALDVGTGSGYNAALLAELGAEVTGIELLPALAERAREALVSAGYGSVDVRVGDGRLGAPDRAPFDAIAVAAATIDVPLALVEQLAQGGRLVLPRGDEWGQELVLLERDGDALRETRSFPCRFVPLRGGPASRATGWRRRGR